MTLRITRKITLQDWPPDYKGCMDKICFDLNMGKNYFEYSMRRNFYRYQLKEKLATSTEREMQKIFLGH